MLTFLAFIAFAALIAAWIAAPNRAERGPEHRATMAIHGAPAAD